MFFFYQNIDYNAKTIYIWQKKLIIYSWQKIKLKYQHYLTTFAIKIVRIKANWEVPKFACVNKMFTSKLGTGI